MTFPTWEMMWDIMLSEVFALTIADYILHFTGLLEEKLLYGQVKACP